MVVSMNRGESRCQYHEQPDFCVLALHATLKINGEERLLGPSVINGKVLCAYHAAKTWAAR